MKSSCRFKDLCFDDRKRLTCLIMELAKSQKLDTNAPSFSKLDDQKTKKDHNRGIDSALCPDESHQSLVVILTLIKFNFFLSTCSSLFMTTKLIVHKFSSMCSFFLKKISLNS